MDSRKDEKGKQQAEIKFKAGERRTKLKDGKGCGRGITEAFLKPDSAKPLGASAQTPWGISETPWAKPESPWDFAADRAIRQRKRIAKSTLDASASDPHTCPRAYPAEGVGEATIAKGFEITTYGKQFGCDGITPRQSAYSLERATAP